MMTDSTSVAAPTPGAARRSSKIRQVLIEDTTGVHLRLYAAQILTFALPNGTCNELRASLLRLAGFHLGPGASVAQTPRINGERGLLDNLVVGARCRIGLLCTFDLLERITIGDDVVIGHQAMFLTSSHEIGPPDRRAGELTRASVTIGDGALIGARAIVLPGVTVGAGATVDEGSVVNKDVDPGTRVAGAPAKVVVERPAG